MYDGFQFLATSHARRVAWVATTLLALAVSALPAVAAPPSVAAVVNSASYRATVAPGSIAAVFGTFPVGSLQMASGIPLPTVLGGISMQSGNMAFPFVYVSGSQLAVQVPWELSGKTEAAVTATANGLTGPPQTVRIAPYAPGIFTANAQGTGQGAILDGSYRLVDSSNPAAPGSALQIYCTGLGAVTNQPPSGAAAPSGPLAETTAKPTVTVGGLAAHVLFSGLTPGLVGLYQVNIEVPLGVTGGNAVPVVISIGGVESNTATVAVASSGVTVSPTAAFALPGGVQSFGGAVANALGGGVLRWSVREGAAGGTVTSEGTYTAPTTPGTLHVVATNAQNPSQTATATVTVLPASAYAILNPSSTAAGTVRNPAGSLVQARTAPNHFYGPSLKGIFEMDGSGNIAPFDDIAYGPDPWAISPLLQASDGNLYGTADLGGPIGRGSVFRMDMTTRRIATLWAFAGLYDPRNAGASPRAPLIQAKDGRLYGTTYEGGNSASCTRRSGCGTVFRMELSGIPTLLHSFSGADGSLPAAPLVEIGDGTFYGTTSAGGANNLGTIFKMDRSGNVTVLRSLSAADGTVPLAGLIEGSDGYFYGTASAGGSASCANPILNGGCGGTVFRVSPAGDFAVLHAFSGPDGNEPVGPLLQASDGHLYGTTWGGGNLACGPSYSLENYPYFRQPGCGTVFRVGPRGDFSVVHAFASLSYGMPQYDGAGPVGGLIQGNDGHLYGTTFYGGTGVTSGSVFRLPLPPQ